MSDENAVEGTEAETEKTQEQPGVETFTTKADKTEGAREITISWDLGKDVAALVEKFGETVIYSMAIKALIIAAQANIRRMLSAQVSETDASLKYSDDAIRNYVFNEYRPGVRAAGVTGGKGNMEKLMAYVMKLTPEQRVEFFQDPKAYMEAHK